MVRWRRDVEVPKDVRRGLPRLVIHTMVVDMTLQPDEKEQRPSNAVMARGQKFERLVEPRSGGLKAWEGFCRAHVQARRSLVRTVLDVATLTL